MERIFRAWALGLVIATSAWGAEEGLVGSWNLGEGSGTVLHDRSGNANQGRIHGAKWVKRGGGFALKFDGVDDYVDCGTGPSLDIRGPITLEAWVNVQGVPAAEPGIVGKFFGSYAITLYKGSCYWYISSGGNACTARIEQEKWHHVAGTFDGTTMKLYLNGRVVNTWASRYKTINPGKNFLMGCIIGDPDSLDPNLTRTAHFNGMLDDVRVYDRALAPGEVHARYRRDAAGYGQDTTWFDRLRLTPYYYFDQGRAVVDVDFTGLMPMRGKASLEGKLVQVGREKPVQTRQSETLPEAGDIEMTFDIGQLAKGAYEIIFQFQDDGGVRSMEKTTFQVPPPKARVASPAEKVVPPLPPARGPAEYELELCKGGGFKLNVGARTYLFESSYSYPHGGENRLLAAASADSSGEPAWTVATQAEGQIKRVSAEGKHYRIERQITPHPNHLTVKDTITNLAKNDIGIILSNRFRPQTGELTASWLGGLKGWGKRDALHNPTAFVAAKDHGIGLVAKDDVLVVQGKVFADKFRAGVTDDIFGLAAGKSYTLEWAVYPHRSEDYYDFLNELRRDLGLNGKHLIGGHASSGMEPPKEKMVRLLNAHVAILGLMQWIPDDKGLSIEGVEFMHYPKFVAALRKVCEDTRKEYPGIKCCIHVALDVYTTNNPDQFADSKITDKNGRQLVWSHDRKYMERYFSKKNLDAGWDWYLFYPALDNSFYPEIMKAVDALFDDVKADGIFADGLMSSHGRHFTYDRWDGHTVEIDPETKTIKRKYASVQLLSQAALIAYCKKIHERGGIVMVDSGPGTLTFAREAPASSYPIESGGHGAAAMTHLAPFPMGFGYPRSRDHRAVYRDALDTLKFGGLYYHYFGEVEHETLLTHMFPITIEEIHAGCVKGKEKFVTMRSGVYGWPATPPAGRRAGRTAGKHGDRNLHWVHLTDARGVPVPHSFLTTVDEAGVRTEITLKENESVVLKKIPISVQSASPINLVVPKYDATAIQLLLNGKGTAEIVVKDGDFSIKPGTAYLVKTDTVKKLRADEEGRLSFKIPLDGQLQVGVESAGKP